MKLQSVQVLRGLAALLVVFYHMRALEVRSILQNGGGETAILGGMINNGYAGVDLFFVISGFIMIYVTGQSTRGVSTSAAFVFARLTRIYPIWWFYAAIRTVYILAVSGSAGVDASGQHPISGSEPLISFLVKSFALMPQSEHPVLGVGWTLVHEVYFYLVFAVILLFPKKFWPALFTGWGLFVVVGSLAGLSEPIASTAIALATYPMTMEFILGAFAGMLVMSGRRWRPGIVTLLSTLALCGALFIQGPEDTFQIGWGRVLWFGLPAACLIYGFASLDLTRRMAWAVPAATGAIVSIAVFQLYGLTDDHALSIRLAATIIALITGAITMLAVIWMGWLLGRTHPAALETLASPLSRLWSATARVGDWSYSLYLCHMVVLVGLIRLFEAIAAQFSGSILASPFNVAGAGILANVCFAVLGVCLTLLAARFSYEWLEKPLIRMFGKMRNGLFRKTAPQLRPAEARAAIW